MTPEERETRQAARMEWAERERQWEMTHFGDEHKASQYERANLSAYLRSEGKIGMAIPLMPRGVFWSRGWSGCPNCGGDVTTHRPNKLYLVVEGEYMRIGWSCTGKPGKWEV